MIQPTGEQQQILDAGLRPLRVTAGAGTGKTTTIALLVCRVIERHGIEPEEVLGVTFTNKAAAELADRIRALVVPVRGPGREAEVHTYHGLAAAVLGELGALVGFERGSEVITPTFARQLLHDVVRRRRFEVFDATYERGIEDIARLGAALGDHLVDPAALIASAQDGEPWPRRRELLAAWEDYRIEKRRLGVVDYADLIASAAELVRRHPEVVDRIRSRYRLVLLDEYQDTNPAQRVLLQGLFGDGFPVVAVGDTDQTIYEWRGASPHNFEAFPQHFPDGEGRPAGDRRLTLNRRSDRRVLEAANAVRRHIRPKADMLRPRRDAGEGSVSVYWAADAVAEADWLADRVTRLHDDGLAWEHMAILFRKNRHIALIRDALVERDVPVEVANLGGLLSIPEVADLRAWMRILHSPEDGPAMLRILMGPRYRLGMGDLVHLSRWVAAQGRHDELDADHERLPEHTILEATDHLAAIASLDPRARAALLRFRVEYRLLLETAQGASLSELARTILDTTGAWRDIEVMSAAARLTARLNLYRFLDLTEEWSPLEGRPSLPAFVYHLAVMEDDPVGELDAARLSGEDAVALLTVHRAKGLEWDAVFIPAVVKDTFPSRVAGAYPDPYRRAEVLPHEWRKDRPPPFDAETPEDVAREHLRQANLVQEWRTAYVAVTRPRRHLYLSGAHWYAQVEPNQKPSVPSELFDLVAELPFVNDLGRAPCPDRPVTLRLDPDLPSPDPLFTDGWASMLRETLHDSGLPARMAADLDLAPAFADAVQEMEGRLFSLDSLGPVEAKSARRATSVTGLVTYAACPRRYYWTEIDRLPRRRSPAARRGVDVHRRIELHNLGRVPFLEVTPDLYDHPEHGEEGGGAFEAFLGSGFGDRRPRLVEVPFTLDTEVGLDIRGRIDAIYDEGDDAWEIVDFKSGRWRPAPWLDVQLEAYALAARRVDFGVPPPAGLAVTVVYLGGGVDARRAEASPEWLRSAGERVEGLAGAIMAERFDPQPGQPCRTCEFARFCPPGRQWLSENLTPGDPDGSRGGSSPGPG